MSRGGIGVDQGLWEGYHWYRAVQKRLRSYLSRRLPCLSTLQLYGCWWEVGTEAGRVRPRPRYADFETEEMEVIMVKIRQISFLRIKPEFISSTLLANDEFINWKSHRGMNKDLQEANEEIRSSNEEW